MLTLHVEVTQHDIEHGEVWDCNYCPVALAVARAAHTNCENVQVGADSIDFDHPSLMTATTPDGVREFIQFFDSCPPAAFDQPQPFAFDLQVYEESDR